MKKHHPSQQSTPKRSRAKKRRVQYQPPREETPFSKPKKRHIRFIDAVYLVVAVIAGSALLGLCQQSFATYLTTRAQLNRHTAHLHQLQEREQSLHQRLAQLKSPKGRDQLLRERGFVKGNERILLFADEAKPAADDTAFAQSPQVDADPVNTEATDTSFWGGIAEAIDHAADRKTQ